MAPTGSTVDIPKKITKTKTKKWCSVVEIGVHWKLKVETNQGLECSWLLADFGS